MTETTTPKRQTRRTDPTTTVLAEVRTVRKELAASRLPVAGGERPEKGRSYHQRQSIRWGAIDQARTLAETPGWDSALLAAAYGALAEPDPERARPNLVRLAALAVAAVEDIGQEGA
ncbi:hypothetical protein [Streptomyces sp. SID10815]|uniref:hypothetical protein n=1 Tax=Streptomyces sp. SID10815 TaxID=2706027 RepID=UPI0013C6D345|nr:hypothetical protein [Streptomyces sp. SID10815]NEA50476.1 hypothetical protein [Streptomyces sp. SID10815]